MKLTESYNSLIHKAAANKALDDMDSVPIVDTRIESQFADNRKGKQAPYSDLMQSFRPGSLLQKGVAMPKRKRFNIEANSLRNIHN